MSELLVIIALMTKTNMVESRSQSKFKYILYEVTLSWDKKTFFWGMDETKCEKAKKEFHEFCSQHIHLMRVCEPWNIFIMIHENNVRKTILRCPVQSIDDNIKPFWHGHKGLTCVFLFLLSGMGIAKKKPHLKY